MKAPNSESRVVYECQVCGASDLESVLFLGYLPPVNHMPTLGERPREEVSFPAELLYCSRCGLGQIGTLVEPTVLFPPEYPYRSGTTKILRENFADLANECLEWLAPTKEKLVLDIGSNDGTLLDAFRERGFRVLGVEPTRMGELARKRGIETVEVFFSLPAAESLLSNYGRASIICATNVFAHIPDVHQIVKGLLKLLAPDGIFVTEVHSLAELIQGLQFDTIYHEHLRNYSLQSLQVLFAQHGLEIFYAKKIPTHGGSLRVYSARTGQRPVSPNVKELLLQETTTEITKESLKEFRRRAVMAKLGLNSILHQIKKSSARIYGVGAPSRAGTLIHYAGIDDGILDCIVEVAESPKTGKYLCGTRIPVIAESHLFEDQPEYALLLSWHIADELIPKLKAKGYQGQFIVPLPEPRIVR